MKNEEIYGIDKEYAHKKAVDLIPNEFFWDCIDEFAPFGSDEGDLALSEWRDWRRENLDKPAFECLIWTIESVGEIDIQKYTASLAKKDVFLDMLNNDEIDEDQYIWTLDVSIIATGFGQLVDEGVIDANSKPYIQIALARQKLWGEYCLEDKEYINRMIVLEKALGKA